MICISTHTLSSPLAPEEVLRRIEQRTYTTAGAAFGALTDRARLPFTGKIDAASFTIYPVQRGRIMPMPRIRGSVVKSSSGSRVLLRSTPNTSGSLTALVWLGFGVFVAFKALPFQGLLIASLSLCFPLAVLAVGCLLMRRECSMAYDTLRADLDVS